MILGKKLNLRSFLKNNKVNTLLFFKIVNAFLLHQAVAQSSLPIFTHFVSPNPAPPPPGEVFQLPVSSTSTPIPSNTPACAEWTRTVGPDETLLITGINFSIFSDAQQGQDTQFIVADKQAHLTRPRIQRLDTDKVILTLPKDLSEWGMYLLWPANQNGYGAPIALNQTEAWWVGPDQVAPGSNVSIYGRNLSHNNDTLISNVYLKPLQPTSISGQWMHVTQVNPYRVNFDLPANLPQGAYEVWTHNGHGGQYGWSGPLKLTIQVGVAWTSTRFDVKAYGALGNGQSDDTPAIQKVLDLARQSPGSTVYFPTGVYLVNDMLLPANNTRWLGQGKDQSILRCGSGFSTQAFSLLYGQVNNLELSNLTLEADHHYKGNYQGNLTTPIDLRGSQDLRLTNVRFSFQDYDILQLDRTYRVFINDCDLIGKISFLGRCSQLFIDRCHFQLTNDTELALHSWGGTGISLTNSTCQDLDNTNPANGAGWGKGRFFVGAGNWGSNRFTYIANNTTTDLAPRSQDGVDQNSGEQFLWEGNGTDWMGSPIASTDYTTTLRDFNTSYQYPHTAIIIKGRGLGQARRITGYNNSTISLETPWTLTPDQSSVLVLGNFVDRIVLYKNYIDGKVQAVTSQAPNASYGIELFGGASNFITDGNTIHEMRAGLANWAVQYEGGISPSYFNLFTHNRMLNCRWGMVNATDVTTPSGTALLGTVYRKNLVNSAFVSGITNVLYPSAYALLNGLVYEHNGFNSVPAGYTTEIHFRGNYDFSTQGGSLANQVFYSNAFAGSNGGSAIAITPQVALRDNTFSGFTTAYQGKQSSPILEAPERVIELKGQIHGEVVETNLILWNSGTGAMTWQSSTEMPWLSLSAKDNNVLDERASASIQLKANPQNLNVGKYTSTVTITAGNQVKRITVNFIITDNFSPTIALGSGLTGEYFNDINLTSPSTVTRTDAQVNFSWPASPISGSINADLFGIRWSGQIEAPVSGTYVFTTICDDGVRLWINGMKVIDNWAFHTAPDNTTIITLVAGQKYDIKMEYFDGYAGAKAQLYWTYGGQGQQIIPQQRLYPAPVPTAPISPTIALGSGLTGEYFNDINLTSPSTVTRTDAQVNFSWPASPISGSINADLFGIRWSGQIEAPVSGTYVFTTICDDGVRLWINGMKVIDNWAFHTAPDNTTIITLVAGQKYDIKMEYFDGYAGAKAQLYWTYGGQGQQIIPQQRLYPAPVPTAPISPTIALGSGLTGEYFNDINLTSPSTVTRTDAQVNFSWPASPISGSINADLFGIRWSGQIEAPVSGTYVFTTICDDGVRLWINGMKVIDNWAFHTAPDNTTIITLVAGQKYDIKMEYFDGYAGAKAQLYWTYGGQGQQIIPQQRLYPAPVPTAPISPTIALGSGLTGEYFNDINLTSPSTVTRTDAQVNFSWPASPISGSINADLFGIRWSGQIEAPVSGTYVFTTICDDGVRLWINGMKVIDNWAFHTAPDNTTIITLVAGQKYDIKMEYFDGYAGAKAQLYWTYGGQGQQIIPQQRLYPAPVPTAPISPHQMPAIDMRVAAIEHETIDSILILQVFPVPANEIVWAHYYAKEAGNALLQLFNITGQQVLELALPIVEGKNAIQIPIRNFNRGLYLLSLSHGYHYLTRRILISN